jgi:hypothetical protein
MLENIEGAIKNETGNIGYTEVEEKQSKNTTQYVLDTTLLKNTNNINKTRALLQSTNNWR